MTVRYPHSSASPLTQPAKHQGQGSTTIPHGNVPPPGGIRTFQHHGNVLDDLGQILRPIKLIKECGNIRNRSESDRIDRSPTSLPRVACASRMARPIP